MTDLGDIFRIEYNGGGCLHVCFVKREDLRFKLNELGTKVRRFDLFGDYYKKISDYE